MKRRAALVGVCLLAVSACTADPPAPSPTDGSGLTVDASTGDNEAATATLGPRGGTVRLATSGVTYVLTVPPRALLTDVTVSMTAVASIGRFPFAAPASAAVLVRPDGLALAAPAVLTISGVTGNTGFQFDGAGFRLVPNASDSGGARLSLLRFSGVGYGTATAAEKDAIPAPLRAVDRVLQDAARDATAWQGRALGAALDELDAAPTDVGPAAAAQALALDLGPDGSAHDRIDVAVAKLRDSASASFKQACQSGTGDPVRLARVLLTLQHLAGTTAGLPIPLVQCVHSVLTVSADIDWWHERPWPDTRATYTFGMTGEAPLSLRSPDPVWSADVPVDVNPLASTDSRCDDELLAGAHAPLLRVTAVLNLNPTWPIADQPSPSLLVSAVPTGDIVVRCPHDGNFRVDFGAGGAGLRGNRYPVPFAGGEVAVSSATRTPGAIVWRTDGTITLTAAITTRG